MIKSKVKVLLQKLSLVRVISITLTSCLLLGNTSCDPENVVPEITISKTFTKLDSAGVALVNQNVAWNTDDAAGSELNYDRWSCLKDDTTGLVWELKPHDGSLRNYAWNYTWYDSNPATNAGEHGVGDLGLGVSTSYQNYDPATNFPGRDDCFDANRCDTEKFVADVNAAGLCGHSDWRLPTKTEAATLFTETTEPFINGAYFPDVQYDKDNNPDKFRHASIWTSITDIEVHKAIIMSFTFGDAGSGFKHLRTHIRLVRGTQN